MRPNKDVLDAQADLSRDRGWPRNFLTEQVLLRFVNDAGADVASIRQLLK